MAYISEKETEIREALNELIDKMEDYYGELLGFEVRVEHSVVDGVRQGFADITEVVLYQLLKTKVVSLETSKKK